MLCPCAYPTCSAHIHTLADCCDHQLLCYAYTVIPQMRPGPFWARPFRTTLLLKHCRPCSCRSRRSSGTSHNLYVQTLSSASAGHECMCACKPCLCLCSSSSVCLDPETVNASSFHLSYFHTCLLQVFLTTKTSCAHAPRQLVTGSVLSTAYYTSQHPTQPQLSSQTATYATRQLAQLFAAAQHNPFFILAFFVSPLSRRAFSHPHTHTSKLICAISQTGRDCSCG